MGDADDVSVGDAVGVCDAAGGRAWGMLCPVFISWADVVDVGRPAAVVDAVGERALANQWLPLSGRSMGDAHNSSPASMAADVSASIPAAKR